MLGVGQARSDEYPGLPQGFRAVQVEVRSPLLVVGEPVRLLAVNGDGGNPGFSILQYRERYIGADEVDGEAVARPLAGEGKAPTGPVPWWWGPGRPRS